MSQDRRSVLSALGLALPFGLSAVRPASAAPLGPAPVLSLRSFEDAVRAAFATASGDADGAFPCRRVEVGHSDLLQSGVQGCTNDRPFAGFASGSLRIVRVGSAPGPTVGGVRLYVCTVEVALTCGRGDGPGRPLDFAALPPAPALLGAGSGTEPAPSREPIRSRTQDA